MFKPLLSELTAPELLDVIRQFDHAVNESNDNDDSSWTATVADWYRDCYIPPEKFKLDLAFALCNGTWGNQTFELRLPMEYRDMDAAYREEVLLKMASQTYSAGHEDSMVTHFWINCLEKINEVLS